MTDSPTIEELLEHEAFLRRLALVLVRDETTAEDLVQDTWLEALRRPPRERINLRHWLAVVARRLSYRRASYTLSPTEIDWSQERPMVENPPEEELERGAVARVVSDHLLSLEEPYRGTLLQRFYEGLTPREISRRTDTSINTINSRLQRGMTLLRQKLDRSYEGRERWQSGLLLLANPTRPRQVPGVPRGLQLLRSHRMPLACFGVASVFGVALFLHSQPEKTPVAETVQVAMSVRKESKPELLAVPAREGRTPVEAISVTQMEDEQIATARAEALTVLVSDPEGTPIAGADVFMVGLGLSESGFRGVQKIRSAGTTDAGGRLRVPLISGDVGFRYGRPSIGLWAEAVGHVRSTLSFLPSAGADTRELSLHVGGPDQEIRGLVLAGLRPVPGAQLTVGGGSHVEYDDDVIRWSQPAFARTGSDGSFVVRGVAPGRKSVVARTAGFSYFETWSDTLGENGRIVIHLERGCSVTGIVRSPDGDPQGGAVVCAQGDPDRPDWMTLTDDEGRFRIDGIPPGPRHLGAYTDDLSQVAWRLFDLSPEEELVWEPSLRPDPPLQIRLVDENGVLLSRYAILVELDSRVPWYREMQLTGPGIHRLVGLPEGRFRVFVYPSSLALDNHRSQPHFSVMFEESPSGLHEVRVPKLTQSRIELLAKVVDARGGARKNTRLQLIHESHIISCAGLIDEITGQVHMANIAPGRYLVGVSGERMGVAVLEERLLVGPEIENLETLRTPQTAELIVPWPYPDGTVFELSQELMGRRRILDRVSSSSRYELFPGTYYLRVRSSNGLSYEESLLIGSRDKIIWPAEVAATTAK